MRSVLHRVACMEVIKVRDIETTQYTPLGRGKLEVIPIRTFDHRGVQGRLHVDAAGSERMDEPTPHGIFVEVEANRHGRFRRRAC